MGALMNIPPEAQEYERRYYGCFIDKFNPGREAEVLVSSNATVVKFHHREPPYARELEVYQFLLERGIESVTGFNIPQLLRSDDELRAIEMSIVRPPFLLDFAGALTDEEHQRLVMDDDEIEDRLFERVNELFDDRAADALAVANAFARLTGYMMMDLHPGNLRFA
jgi:hypothetical protein